MAANLMHQLKANESARPPLPTRSLFPASLCLIPRMLSILQSLLGGIFLSCHWITWPDHPWTRRSSTHPLEAEDWVGSTVNCRDVVSGKGSVFSCSYWKLLCPLPFPANPCPGSLLSMPHASCTPPVSHPVSQCQDILQHQPIPLWWNGNSTASQGKTGTLCLGWNRSWQMWPRSGAPARGFHFSTWERPLCLYLAEEFTQKALRKLRACALLWSQSTPIFSFSGTGKVPPDRPSCRSVMSPDHQLFPNWKAPDSSPFPPLHFPTNAGSFWDLVTGPECSTANKAVR